MRLSYSALSAFNQCPKKYKWQYIDRVKVPPTPDLFFGSLIHEVLEVMLKNDPVVPPLDKMIEYYNNRWNPGVFKGDISAKEYYDEGLLIIKTFYNSHTPGLTTIFEIEKFFEIYWEGHKIVGKIDRVDKLPTGEIEIIDYKTNRKLPHEDDFNYDFQLPLYQWAATNTWGNADKVKLSLYYLRHNKKITPETLKSQEELQNYIRSSVDSIQKSDFSANPSKLCSWCGYIDKCEEGQNFIRNSNRTKGIKKEPESVPLSDLNQGSLF